MSNSVLGHGRKGLQLTFAVTLVLLFASGVILLRAVTTYPRDVATASASRDRQRPASRRNRAPGAAGSAPDWPDPASPPGQPGILEVRRPDAPPEPWPDPPGVPM